MKKVILSLVFAATAAVTSQAQIQKDTWMVGAQLANFQFTNGFYMNLSPQVGYFIKDRLAIGGQVGLSVASPEGSSATQTNWSLGAFGRYYFSNKEVNSMLKNGAFFAQANAGFGGNNSSTGNTTNGVDLGISAGYAYFITRNVGLEGSLGYGGKVGGGNETFQGDLKLNVGFQIYLPTSTAKKALRDN